MLPDDEGASDEDPDLIAERIIASIRFLTETAEKSGNSYLATPLNQCLTACENAYLNDKRRRFARSESAKPKNGK